jgi:hypothetical protein
MSLPSNPTPASNIKLVKLKTGEEIIGEVTTQMNGDISMKNVVSLILANQNQMAFMPYIPFCDFDTTGLQIKVADYIFMAPLKKDMENEYRKVFNKVVLPAAIQGGLKLVN